jgi:nucleoid DNA-binding protein
MSKSGTRETTDYGTRWLIREIARRADFTVADVKIIFDTFREIVAEIVLEKKSLYIRNLFLMTINKTKAYRGFDTVRRVHIDIPENYRIKMNASRRLHMSIREWGKLDSSTDSVEDNDIDMDEFEDE